MHYGFIEAFSSCREDGCLKEHLLSILRRIRHLIAAWRNDYLSPTVQEPKRSQSTGFPQPVSKRPNPEQNQLLNEGTINKKGSGSLAFRPLPVHLQPT